MDGIVNVFDLELQTQQDLTFLHVGSPAQFLQNRICSNAVHFQMQNGGSLFAHTPIPMPASYQGLRVRFPRGTLMSCYW